MFRHLIGFLCLAGPVFGQAVINESGIPATNTYYVDASAPSGGNGTAGSPFHAIQTAVDVAMANYTAASPQKSKVIIQPGIYRESVVLNLANTTGAAHQQGINARSAGAVVVLEGAAPTGVIIDGADPFTSWTQDGASPRYFTTWMQAWGQNPNELSGVSAGVNSPNAVARRREMVFFNGKLLEPKLSLSAMTWGTFYVDEAAQRLYIQPPSGTSPASATVEVSTRTTGIDVIGLSNVVLRNLTVRRVASWIENGNAGIQVRSKPFSGTDWVRPRDVLIENCRAEWNSAAGIMAGNRGLRVTLRNSVSSHNGANGLALIGHYSLVEDCEFAGNAWRMLWGDYLGWNDGAVRVNNLTNTTFRRVDVLHNLTKGFWLDTCGGGITIDDCDVEGNLQGVFLEISTVVPGNAGYLIKNSRILRNRVGIESFNSPQLSIVDSEVRENGSVQISPRYVASRTEPHAITTFPGLDPELAVTTTYGTADLDHCSQWRIERSTIGVLSPLSNLIDGSSDPQFASTLTARDNTYRSFDGGGFSVTAGTRLRFSEWRTLTGSGGATLDAGSMLTAPVIEPRRSATIGTVEVQTYAGLGGDGVPSGFSLASAMENVTLDRGYQHNRPRAYYYAPTLETIDGSDTRSANVIRGWITAPATGVYRFWVSADDVADFRLSTDVSPANLQAVASATAGNGKRRWLWDLDAERSSDAQFPSGIALVAGQSYYFELRHLSDAFYASHAGVAWLRPGADTSTGFAREPVPASAITPDVTPTGDGRSGAVLREFWTDVPRNASGTITVDDLQAFASYPLHPRGFSFPSLTQSPVRVSADLGTRLRGFLTPPVTGTYKFWLSGAFRGQFQLSSDASPANLRPQPLALANNQGFRVWNARADQNSSGQSPPIPSAWVTLTAGQSYYFEVIGASHYGDDHIELAWARPDLGGANAAVPDEVIPSARLAPYLPVPAMPGGAAVQLVTPTQVRLTWTDAANNESGYRLERRTGGGAWQSVAYAGENAATIDDMAAPANTAFEYRLVAFNAFGDSIASDPLGVTTGTAALPSAPASVAASAASSNLINVSWSDLATDEIRYEVERSAGGGAYVLLDRLASGSTGYGDPTVSAGTGYTYRVRAFSPSGYSAYGVSSTVVPPSASTTPLAPSTLAAVAASSSQINLTWADNSNNEDSFAIEYSTTGVAGPWIAFGSAPVNAVSLAATGLNPNTPYHWRIRSQNSLGNSAWSNTPSATTQPSAIPASPANLAATASVSGVNLTWTDKSPNETGFVIERKIGVGGQWTVLTTTAANATAYPDSALSSNITAYYRVSATNANGSSAPSGTATATTPTPGSLGFAPFADLPASQGRPSSNYGIANGPQPLTIYKSSATSTWKSWLKFDVGAFTEGLHRATLSFRTSNPPPSFDIIIQVWGLADGNDAWSETTLTWNNAPGNVTSGNGVANATLLGSVILTPDTPENGAVVLLGEEGSPLVNFLNARGADHTVTFILTSTTSNSFVFLHRSRNWLPEPPYPASPYAPQLLLEAALPAPSAPSGFTATGVNSNRIALAWADTDTVEESFLLERRPSAGGDWAVLASLPFGTTSHDDNSVSAGVPYDYRLSAINTAGASAAVSASTTAAPPTAVASEDFNYADGNLPGQNGGTEWTGAWLSASNTMTVAEGSLAYVKIGFALRGSSNRALRTGGNNWTIMARRPVTLPASYLDGGGNIGKDGTSVWISTLIRRDSTAENNLIWINGRRASGATSAFAFGRVDGANLNLGVMGPTLKTYTGQTAVKDSTYLLVARIDYTSTTDTITMWVNPDLGASSPQNALATATRTEGDMSFTSLDLRIGNLIDASFDEIRVGRSFAEVTPAVPAPPSDLAATPTSSSTVTLSWTDASIGETGFLIERKPNGGSFSSLVTVDASQTSFPDTGLLPGSTYVYRISSTGTDGNSPLSTEASATTLTAREDWRRVNFSSILNAGPSADSSDPDNDGVMNFLEYAFGLDPATTDPGGLPSASVEPGSGDHLALTFERQALTDLTYTVESSDNLTSWTPIRSSSGAANVRETLTVLDAVDLSASPRRFLRLRVTSP